MLVLILLLGFLPRLMFLVSPLESIIKVVPDDAFYYFKVAQNVVAGYGSTFDGINPTNGYHPLWLVLLLPIAKFVHNPLLFTRLSLLLSVLFNLLSAVLVYKIVAVLVCVGPVGNSSHPTASPPKISYLGGCRRSMGPPPLLTPTKRGSTWLPLLATAFYYFNPRVVANSLNGLETSLNTFLLLLIINYSLFTAKKSFGLFCLLLGLLFLARTDNVFYIAAILAMTTIMIDRLQLWTDYREWLRKIAVVSIIFLLTISPWLIWNYLKFGTIIQSSGMAFPYVIKQNFLFSGNTKNQLLLASVKRFITFLVWGIYPLLGIGKYIYLGLFLVMLLTIVFCIDVSKHRYRVGIFLKVLFLLLIGGGGLTFFHTAIRWYPRHWYFDSLIPLSTILFSVSLFNFLGPGIDSSRPTSSQITGARRDALRRHHPKMVVVILSVVVLLFVLVVTYVKSLNLLSKGDYPHQTEMLAAADWARNNLSKNETVGAFNAGILSFFSGKVVINLDGVINNNACEAVKNKELAKYIKDSKIGYLIDYQPFMLNFYQPFLGGEKLNLEKVVEFDNEAVDWEKSKMVVYNMVDD